MTIRGKESLFRNQGRTYLPQTVVVRKSKKCHCTPWGNKADGHSPYPKRMEVIPAIYHCSIQIIGRSKGRSAVGAAAYRSGEKILNTWDGVTHDYTNKGGVIYKEILLPSHAPPQYTERAVLWNAVEQIEKNKHAQLAREINVALPVELGRGEQIDLVRDYCQKNFVDAGMCADFAIHDNYTGNPHAHILLTMRPLKQDGTWDDKQRKVYCRDENGNRIYDPQTRLYACETIATTDWNRREKAELWRSSWAELCNQYLARNDFDLKIDHRSYERQGIALKPTIHLGPSVTEIERRGIRTEKGDYNRTIMEENSMMRQVRARVSNLHGWNKNHARGAQNGLIRKWYGISFKAIHGTPLPRKIAVSGRRLTFRSIGFRHQQISIIRSKD